MSLHNKPPPPSTIVIFGANGDLTHRLIVPALYNLSRIMSGDGLGEIVDALVAQDQADRLAEFEAADS